MPHWPAWVAMKSSTCRRAAAFGCIASRRLGRSKERTKLRGGARNSFPSMSARVAASAVAVSASVCTPPRRSRTSAQRQILGPEVMPPLRDAVRLVDGQQARAGAAQQRQDFRPDQAFGSDVEQVQAALAQGSADARVFPGIVGRIQAGGGDAERPQLRPPDRASARSAARRRRSARSEPASAADSTAICRCRWASPRARRRRRVRRRSPPPGPAGRSRSRTPGSARLAPLPAMPPPVQAPVSSLVKSTTMSSSPTTYWQASRKRGRWLMLSDSSPPSSLPIARSRNSSSNVSAGSVPPGEGSTWTMQAAQPPASQLNRIGMPCSRATASSVGRGRRGRVETDGLAETGCHEADRPHPSPFPERRTPHGRSHRAAAGGDCSAPAGCFSCAFATIPFGRSAAAQPQ